MIKYDVEYGSKTVGNVAVEIIGLYTRFTCRCIRPADGIFRVVAYYGAEATNLGICVPEGRECITTAKIPTSQINDGTPRFCLVRHDCDEAECIPVACNIQAHYLTRLPDAKFKCQTKCIEISHRCGT